MGCGPAIGDRGLMLAQLPSRGRRAVLAHGSPVLASGAMDEQVALAGGRIWVGNPIDAFSRADQAVYLDWLAGDASGRRALAPDVRVMLVARGPGPRR